MTAAARPDYAGLVSRTVAYVMDVLLVAVVASGGIAVLVVVATVAGPSAQDVAKAAASAYVFFLPVVLALYCAMFWLFAGRTPGMAVLGLRVVRADGKPLRWFSASVRAVLLACFPLGALWLLVDRRHQALHDKVARTVVIRAVRPSSRLDDARVRTGPEPA